MFSQLVKLVVVLSLASTISYSRFQFAHAQEYDNDDLDVEVEEEWDDGEDFDDDDEEAADPWANTDDIKPMDDALPGSVFAVIHLSQDSISESPGLMEFIQFELPNYPKLTARDVKQSPAKLRFFESNEAVTMYTISEALENNAVPEDQLAEVEKIEMPARELILAMALNEVDLTGLDADEIQGILADHNVLREEIAVDDDDMDLFDDDEIDAEIFGEDGEPVAKKPRRRKKRGDWRKRRAERLAREETQEKKKRDAAGASGGIPGVSLAIPGPILFLIVCAGLGAMGYVGYVLVKTQESTLKAEERKKLKSQKKIEKRLKKEASKIKKKR